MIRYLFGLATAALLLGAFPAFAQAPVPHIGGGAPGMAGPRIMTPPHPRAPDLVSPPAAKPSAADRRAAKAAKPARTKPPAPAPLRAQVPPPAPGPLPPRP